MYGSGITVTRTGYDSAGIETDVAEDVAEYVYLVTLLKRITGESFGMAVANPSGTTSSISISILENSGAPLSGKFTITCRESENAQNFTTSEIGFGHWTQGI